MLDGIFDNLQFWHWWIFAVLLMILEVFSPGAFFMWMGAAAGVIGLVLLFIPDMSWQLQFILFTVLSFITIIVGRTYFNRDKNDFDDPTIGELEQSLIGKVVEVEQAIQNGTGRVKVGETTWKANGPDCPAGHSVKVVGVNGAVLMVEPI